MVTEDNQAKIMDFGLARMTGGTLITQEGMTMGTIAYMSPEQVRGEEVDHRTDIWSLGVVLYEMFGGQLPFKGEQDQAVVYAILNMKPKPTTELRTEIPISIGQVVDKALEKNPDKRYQQIDELLDDLKSISVGIVPEEIKVRLRKAKLRRRKRTILYTCAAGLVIAMVVIALNLFMGGRAEAIDSIAVLPLENLTGDLEQEYFVDGVTDELIGQLAQISALRVISRQSVMRYKESDKSLPEIARDLNVDAVVEGTVHHVGESVRIRVQLIDALPEERNLWAQTYNRAMPDVLVMYREMANAIVGEIQVRLTPEEEARFASTRQVDPEAYKAYLRGQFHWSQFTPQDFEIALHYYESALEKDPNYALAHTGIALVWIGRMQANLVLPSEATPRAKEAALRALELDDTIAEAHCALALIRGGHEWDWEAAMPGLKRAIELNPNFPDARAFYSHFLNIIGRPEEALEQIERALELEPFNPMFQAFYSVDLLFLRRYDDAIAQAQNVLRATPNHPVATSSLYMAYAEKGMYEEWLTVAKGQWTMLGQKEVVEALERGYAEGDYKGAMKLAVETLEANPLTPFPVDIAFLHIFLDNNDKAMAWLERAVEARDPNTIYLRLPIYDSLRDDPRFQDLMQRMNLAEGK
jgi:TolB-like protein/TPR repeat protein